jgi:hypothetical protein
MQAYPLQGPYNRDFFGPEMAMSEALDISGPKMKSKAKIKKAGTLVILHTCVSLVAISGPQKVSIFRAHPFQWPL